MCAFPKSRDGQSRVAEEPAMRSRMSLTSKCQLVLHFLLFTLTVPRTGVHNHAKGSLHIWTLYFLLLLSNFLKVVVEYELKKGSEEKAKGEALCVCFFSWQRDGSLLWGHSLDLGRPHRLFGVSRKAYYPFGESTGQGSATCPLQSPQQQDLLDWRYTAHYSVMRQRVSELWGSKEGAMEKKRGWNCQSIWTWTAEGHKVNLFRDICFKRLFFPRAVSILAGLDTMHGIDWVKLTLHLKGKKKKLALTF